MLKPGLISQQMRPTPPVGRHPTRSLTILPKQDNLSRARARIMKFLNCLTRYYIKENKKHLLTN